jgi:hypothetical protein
MLLLQVTGCPAGNVLAYASGTLAAPVPWRVQQAGLVGSLGAKLGAGAGATQVRGGNVTRISSHGCKFQMRSPLPHPTPPTVGVGDVSKLQRLPPSISLYLALTSRRPL